MSLSLLSLLMPFPSVPDHPYQSQPYQTVPSEQERLGAVCQKFAALCEKLTCSIFPCFFYPTGLRFGLSRWRYAAADLVQTQRMRCIMRNQFLPLLMSVSSLILLTSSYVEGGIITRFENFDSDPGWTSIGDCSGSPGTGESASLR